MKKYFFVIAIGLTAAVSNAQNVGIGTPNPQNKLHVAGGFRLDTLTGVNGAGLLWHNPNGVVYGIKFSGNINEVLRGDGTFGAYNPAINGALGWLLTGNSGTNPASNFLGTTDNQPLVFKVNNIRHGYLSNTSIFWGSNAGEFNTGNSNIGIGSGALGKNTTNGRLIAIGDSALYNNLGNISPAIAATDNIAIGYKSLYANVFGSSNVAIGSNALEFNRNANNTAIGQQTLRSNSDGFNNSAVGSFALHKNTYGAWNSAFGAYTLYDNTTGNSNSAVGFFALQLGNGSRNSAVGYQALRLNTASENSAFGYNALALNTSGSHNNAFGAYALEKNSLTYYNNAFGTNTLKNNVNGWYNSAFGSDALQANDNFYNSAFGYVALRSNVSGQANTAIGMQTLLNNISGSYNTAIGMSAGSGLPNNVSNVTVIGYGTGWNTTISNQVNVGNFSIGWIGGQVGWFHYSDKRIKNNIKDDVPGLSFITRLKPITYHVDIRKQEEIANAGKDETNSELIKPVQKDWERNYDVEKIKMTGFFAQDVEEAAKAINYSFNGVHNPKNGGLYSLDYSAFVVPLVKAVQEQQKIIDDQNKKIDKQQQQIDLLIKEMQSLRKDLITQKN